MAAIRARRADVLGLDAASILAGTPTPDQIALNLLEDACIPETDVVIAETDGDALGYAIVKSWLENDGTLVHIHHEYSRDGVTPLDLVLMEWAEHRIRTLAVTHAGRRVLAANACTREAARVAMLSHRGYEQVFAQVEMLRDDPTSPVITGLPDGLDVRPIQQAHLRAIWELNNAVYEDRAWSAAPTESAFVDFTKGALDDPELWQVAWHDDVIVGFVRTVATASGAVVDEVSVAPAYRRQGVGRALLGRALKILATRGQSVVRLHTSADNVAGAQGLYESCGFRRVDLHGRYRKPLAVEELASVE